MIPADALTGPHNHLGGRFGTRPLDLVRKAIEQRRVVLAFQPIVQAQDQSMVAFYEGLIRVVDDSGRVLPAAEFLPTVENSELGRELDCIALERGLIELRREPWLRLAINMSARSIGYRKWGRVLQRGIDADPTVAERLILEITESSAILVPELVTQFMTDIQARGVSFAIDDFGAGYTALRHFREFTFDILKIDGGFSAGVGQDRGNQAMIAAMADIARHFDLLTVAEHVETPQDAECLAGLGIDCLQGYTFAAPTVRPSWRAADAAEQIA